MLLDLSATFDTIDHDSLFMLLEKFVGISGSALLCSAADKVIFLYRTQRAVIKGILSDFCKSCLWGASRFCFRAHDALFVFVTPLCHPNMLDLLLWLLIYLCNQ